MNNKPRRCLSLLSNCKSLKVVKQIHSSLVATGLHNDPFFVGKLLLHCAEAIPDGMEYARTLFLHFPEPDVFMYNTLIRGFSDSGMPQNAFLTFVDLYRKSVNPPDSFSFAFVLKSAANCRSLRDGIQLHCQAFLHGLNTHLFVGTTLISMYGECGSVEFARKVFEEMPQPNVVAWNAIVTSYLRGGDTEGAQKMFDRMPVRDLTSSNVMLAGYTKAGELELAKMVFLDMALKDDVSWSTMISGFAHNGCFDEAFRYFRELRRVGMKLNEVSLTSVLNACAQTGAFDFGNILHGLIEISGFTWITSVNNALMDTYSKCGNVEMAHLIFEKMSDKKCIISWTTMIAGLAMHGHGKQAIQLFHEMENSGVRPDGISFISILYACSHAGLIEQGRAYFSKMTKVYNIEPTVEHYGCMVDLYGRAGNLQAAYEFACTMRIPPTAIIWRTLLGACSIHGNVELAEQVKQKLSKLDPDNSGDHVLLSNIYAVAGKWKDVATVRKTMTDEKIKKSPGWSVIEVDKIMYSFMAGEKPNEITVEAYNKLREIMSRLRTEGGYVPEVVSVLHDIDDEEKEDSVVKHSEKLAVAFGISRMCKGKVIRIVKNLRICRDCHTVMKLISKVYGLEIVVRDRSRFHSFRDGSCSCKDYW